MEAPGKGHEMGTARVHEGIRQMRFEGLLEQQSQGEITQEEAAGVLGVSVRTFQRWAERYEEDGAEGLKDGRLNRPSPRRAPRAELDRMLDLYCDQYADFTVSIGFRSGPLIGIQKGPLRFAL